MENDTAETQAGPEGLDEGERETGRLEAFSDGVFAIAVTLLILTIQVPAPPKDLAHAGHLLEALQGEWPAFVAYLISFAFILIMWVNHHNLFRLIHRTDQTFLLINGLLLLFVTFVPFPTALLAQYLHSPTSTPTDRAVALAVFNGTYVMIGVAFNLVWRYAAHHGRLLSRRAGPEVVAEVHRRYRYGPLYLLCLVIGLLVALDPWNLVVSLALNVGLAGFWALPGRTPYRARAEAKVREAERLG
jgi:uncharacterized membrane protein